MKNYLKVEELKEGWLYHIKARNADFGIWFESEQGFLTRRAKFNLIYTFTEIHWDLSDNFGTAKPLLELEPSPFSVKDLEYVQDEKHKHKIFRPKEKDILDWLNIKSEEWISRLGR